MSNNDTRQTNQRIERNKIRLVCLECGKTKTVSPTTKTEPRCACGSVDLDVA